MTIDDDALHEWARHYRFERDLIAKARGYRDAGMTLDDAVVKALRSVRVYEVKALAAWHIREGIESADRLAVLEIERKAERPAPPPAPPKRGTAAYQEWVETTEEGKRHESIEQKYLEQEEEANRKLWRSMETALENYAQARIMEWTEELLGSEFALPDGTRVRWGAATVDQHRERFELFRRNAHANLEGAARHRRAIEALEAAHVSSLYELAARAA